HHREHRVVAPGGPAARPAGVHLAALLLPDRPRLGGPRGRPGGPDAWDGPLRPARAADAGRLRRLGGGLAGALQALPRGRRDGGGQPAQGVRDVLERPRPPAAQAPDREDHPGRSGGQHLCRGAPAGFPGARLRGRDGAGCDRRGPERGRRRLPGRAGELPGAGACPLDDAGDGPIHRGRSRGSACANAKRRAMIHYPAYKVAAAHVAPVFLDTDRSVEKACSVIEEAAGNGARLIAFPEAFLPGFPVWAALEAPIRTHELFKALAASAVAIDGPELARIRQTARRHGAFVSVGFTEGTKTSVGCLWNANVLIGADGAVLNHHRKLVPTYYEKLIWANGDGSGLRVCGTELG